LRNADLAATQGYMGVVNGAGAIRRFENLHGRFDGEVLGLFTA